MAIETMLVPVDGSPVSEHAIGYALGVAERHRASVHFALVHDFPPPAELGWSYEQGLQGVSVYEAEELYLRGLMERVQWPAGVHGCARHLRGDVAKILTEYVRAHRVALVVMGTHGRGGLKRLWLGSVAERMLRRSSVPILFVGPGVVDGRPLAPRRIRRALVALDGSAAAERALVCARDTLPADTDLVLLRVVVPPFVPTMYLDNPRTLVADFVRRDRRAAADALRNTCSTLGIKARTAVAIHGQPAVAIIQRARALEADVIVLGTRGIGRVERFMIGSVADRVIRSAAIPVLVGPRDRRGPED